MPALPHPDRQPRYDASSGSRATFSLEEYGLARPFASFLPGIAGPLGVPLWCYYVNRGQGICSFGVENKDGAILEFEPANKAYELAPLLGFRSFLRLGSGAGAEFYEPFQENQANRRFRRSTRLSILPHELRLSEENLDLGLRVELRYFGLASRPLAALCREISIQRLGGGSLELEILDGLPRVAPYGLGDLARKTMGRTMEAWSHAEGLEEGLPFLRQRSSSADTAEVLAVEEGHFFAGRFEGGLKARPLVDPARVFGESGELSFPAPYASGALDLEGQRVENRSPCAFLHGSWRLERDRPLRLRSVYGRASSLEAARELEGELARAGSFEAWAEENRAQVMAAAAGGWISSAQPALDGYALQNFLDNVLRGGLPVTLQDGGRKSVLHLYSRKHGDLERDYNAFSLAPSPYSQGNGAYRDICQNRRNDAWTNPDLGDANLRYFADLLQLDGHNPLSVQGLEYSWSGGEEGAARLRALLGPEDAAALLERLDKPFTPRSLHTFCLQGGPRRLKILAELTAAVLTRSHASEKAEPEHGYWSDHGFYLLDSLDAFAALYPERLDALLREESFTWYDNPLTVAPLAAKLKKTPRGWRQYGAVTHDDAKAALIGSRRERPHLARSAQGRGPVFRSSLATKLLCLAANKLATLDAAGRGLLMDADKPDWYDALNGLPALFGSSTNESAELLRLLRFLRGRLPALDGLALPVELDGFLRGLEQAPAEPLAFWRRALELKESYRSDTRLGVDGACVRRSAAELEAFLAPACARVERGLRDSRRPDGLLHTYFINAPRVEEGGPQPRIAGFDQEALPAFLEGQVHALRLAEPAAAAELAKAVEASELYDRPLGMFKVNASLEGTPMEIGRTRAFTPGWLENESIFMHMEYKYLLELLRQDLCGDFYRHLFRACPAYLDPARYGRSTFENSSFIASSANPDPASHGRGFVARLSGTTCEFIAMQLAMALGPQPFRLEAGRLRFAPAPRLHGSLFHPAPAEVALPEGGSLELQAGDYALRCFGRSLLVLRGVPGRHCFGPGGLQVKALRLHRGGQPAERGAWLEGAEAEALRRGEFSRLDIQLG